MSAAILALWTLLAGAEAAPADDVSAVLYADLTARLAVHQRGGRWQSGDSAILAWSCGQELSALVDLFEATGEPKWLDQLVRYADAMFAHLTPNRDGFRSWRSRGYSSFHVRLERAGAKGNAALEPTAQWLRQPQVWTRELLRPELTGQAIPVDWQYRLTWQPEGKLQVQGATTGKMLASVAVRPGEPFEPLPGVKVTLRGQPAAGEQFVLSVDHPKDFDHAVHDGVVLTAICRFIALVRTQQTLPPTYRQKADGYLKVIESDLIPKWDASWRDWKDGGLLVAPVDEALTYPGISLPHNQYLALGNALVWLHRITGKPVYRDRAAKMGRFFKSCLRLVDDHYDWNYWDATGPWDKPWDNPKEKRPEDTGHGSLDLGFVIDAAQSEIVFDRTDLQRFAQTFRKVMWNNSRTDPSVGGYVNTAKPTRQSGNLQDWVRLARAEPQVLEICAGIIPKSGSTKAKAQLLRLLAEKRKGQAQWAATRGKKGGQNCFRPPRGFPPPFSRGENSSDPFSSSSRCPPGYSNHHCLLSCVSFGRGDATFLLSGAG